VSNRPTPVDAALHEYVIAHGTREDALLRRLREETLATGVPNLQVSPDQGAALAMLCRLVGARRVIEVGTFTGYSSLCMARTLPADGRLVACDVSVEWTDIARRYWAEAGVADRVELRLAPALDTLDALRSDGADGSFDLAFLDADKERYPEYAERLLALLRPGGVLAVDNVLWSGRVLDAEAPGDAVRAIRDLNAQLAADHRVDVVMLTVGDGLTVARRRA
jgi:predicted O-methyltransferase YrrM